MHRRFTLANSRLRFIEEPSDQDGGSGGGGAEGSSQEDDQHDDGDSGDDEHDEDESKFDASRALEKIRKLNSENKNLREAKKAAEEKAKGADQHSERIKALEAENLRIRIGARHGLPDELIDRLRGDTEDEILADAEKLLGLVAAKVPPTQRPKERPGGGGGSQEPVDETDVSKIGERMFRR
jgi:hypothetical protein